MDDVQSDPSLRRALEDVRIHGSTHERRSFLQHIIQLARRSPPGSIFSSLCRQLAKLSFEIGEHEDGIFHLLDSHAVLLRLKAITKFERSLRSNISNGFVIDKKYIEFQGEYSNGYDSVLKRLQSMPKEWTIVQIDCEVDAVWRFGGPHAKKWTPKLHIIRMECGPNPQFKPLHFELTPPPECEQFAVLEEIQLMRKKNKTDHLRENKRAFWEARLHVDEILQGIIEFINLKWLGSLTPCLSGCLEDFKLREEIKESVFKIISLIENTLDEGFVSEENVCLLLKAAENLHLLNEDTLVRVISRVLNKHPDPVVMKKILSELDSLRLEYSSRLSVARKHPVILILDEKLESIPFESLETLKSHPVTRMPSLHFVHGLYLVHEDSIENGVKLLDSKLGFYVINPSQDLNAMEERMTNFLLPRVPFWKGVVGERLPTDEWCEALKEHDLFIYMGHGSGSQYWNVEQISSGIRSAAILFGCKSAGYNTQHGCIEMDGSLQSMLAAACPCMVGMLWEVTDKDTDLVAQATLNACLPKYGEDLSTSQGSMKKPKGRKKVLAVPSILPPAEPEVARAVNIGRGAARFLVTQAAVIIRGLPVYIK